MFYRQLTIAFSLTLIFSGSTQAQKLILTREQNEQWFAKFSVQPLCGKLQLIKERLLTDTAVWIPEKGDIIRFPPKGAPLGIMKPLYVIRNNGFLHRRPQFYQSNRCRTETVRQFIALLREEDISSIDLICDPNGEPNSKKPIAIGAILITPKSREFVKAVKAIAN